MPWRALKLTKMKSSINLEAFCTLNRFHISKTDEKNSMAILVITACDHFSSQPKNANKFLTKLSTKSRWSRAVITKIAIDFFSSDFEIWNRFKVQNASKFIELFIFDSFSARQGIPARLEAHKHPSKVRILLKMEDFFRFYLTSEPPRSVMRASHARHWNRIEK